MKVLHINGSTTGGAAKAALRLHFAMLRAGLNSSFLARRRGEECGERCFSIPAWRGKFVAPLIRAIFSKIFIRSSSSTSSIALPGAGLRFNPLVKGADVIFLHWMQQGILDLRDLEWLVKQKKKVFWLLHDYNSITGACCNPMGCELFLHDCKNCSIVKSRFFNVPWWNLKRKRLVLRGASNVTFVPLSQVSFRLASAHGALSFGRVSHPIPNCLSSDVFYYRGKEKSRKALNLPLSRKLVLFGAAGGINNKLKGWDFLEKCLYVCREHDASIEAVVFGASKPEGWNCSIPTHFMGNIKDESVLAELYSACDVFAICSKDETFCQTLIESLSCGTPVVGLPVGILPEFSIPEVRCVRSGEVEEFVMEIMSILGKNPQANDKRRLHHVIHEEYGEASVIRKYIKLVENE